MIEIRRLDLADAALLDELVALQRAAYAVEAELLGTDALPALRESAAEVAACGESFLGAFDDGGLAGLIAWRCDGGAIDIHRLAVAPRAFRRGIGRALVAALEQVQPEATRWVVATGEENAPARALYESLGFRATRRRVAAGGVATVEFTRP